MSLRKNAKILGISPAYLSLLIGGKRPWRGNLKDRYEELVNTFVNTHKSNKITVGESQDNSCLESGAQGGSRTHTPLRGANFKSAASAIPPPGLVFVGHKGCA
jgi:hypothetical protein